MDTELKKYFNKHSSNIRNAWQGIHSIVNVKNKLNLCLTQADIIVKITEEKKCSQSYQWLFCKSRT